MIKWNYNRGQPELPLVLFNGYRLDNSVSVASRISVNATAGGNQITIANVHTDDSGVYSCIELEQPSRNIIFHLDVQGMSHKFFQ